MKEKEQKRERKGNTDRKKRQRKSETAKKRESG